MGLITWIVIGVVILAILGLGWQVFFDGVVEGAERVGDNPVVEKITEGAQSLGNEAKEAIENMR